MGTPTLPDWVQLTIVPEFQTDALVSKMVDPFQVPMHRRLLLNVCRFFPFSISCEVVLVWMRYWELGGVGADIWGQLSEVFTDCAFCRGEMIV